MEFCVSLPRLRGELRNAERTERCQRTQTAEAELRVLLNKEAKIDERRLLLRSVDVEYLCDLLEEKMAQADTMTNTLR